MQKPPTRAGRRGVIMVASEQEAAMKTFRSLVVAITVAAGLSACVPPPPGPGWDPYPGPAWGPAHRPGPAFAPGPGPGHGFWGHLGGPGPGPFR